MQGFIRHICIPFPTFDYPQPTRAILHEAHIENLGLIRDTCTGIQTLELSVPPEHCNYALHHSAIAGEKLNLLDMRFKKFPSLEKTIDNFKVDPQQDPNDDLMKTMQGHGWTVKITELPKVWISCDDRVEFDNEEDCNAYDSKLFQREMEEEEEKEYYRRRCDPYWKNDSDYD